jgi:hypothetical protein
VQRLYGIGENSDRLRKAWNLSASPEGMAWNSAVRPLLSERDPARDRAGCRRSVAGKLSQDSCPVRKAGVKREGQLAQGPSSEAAFPRPTDTLLVGAGESAVVGGGFVVYEKT